MKNKLLLIILVFVLGIFRIGNAATFYYFNDLERNIEYSKACVGCGSNPIEISLVPEPEVDEEEESDEIIITTPRGISYSVSGNAVNKIINRGGIFTELNNKLYSIIFDRNRVGLYYEKEIENLNIASSYGGMKKYKICLASLNDGDISVSKDNGSHAFFVCKDCVKCCSRQGCTGLVASNGFSIPPKPGYAKDTEKLILSKYCEKHACSFFWNINNGNSNISAVEGLDCKAEVMYGSEFCERHTCKAVNCNKPVIGWNVTDGRSSELLIYQGTDENQYSNYCVDHFCKHYKCNEQRRSVTSGSAEFYEGRYIYFPGYCTEHGMDCTIKDCKNPVINTHDDEENKATIYICEYHTTHYEEIKDLSVETGEQLQPTEVVGISESNIERAVCAKCKRYLPRKIKNQDREYGGLVDGKWYCNVCYARRFIENLAKYEVNVFRDGNEFTYNYPVTARYIDPATCEHLKYPILNNVRFNNINNKTHTQVWVCMNCKAPQQETYEHIYIEGVCVCGYKEDGYNNEDNIEERRIIAIENAEYVMTHSYYEEVVNDTIRTDEVVLVQLKDSNSVRLKILSDKLSGLTYKWEGRQTGYSEKIPSKLELEINGNASEVKNYKLEKPDYILELGYRTKGESKTASIKYQIYLP